MSDRAWLIVIGVLLTALLILEQLFPIPRLKYAFMSDIKRLEERIDRLEKK